MNVAIILPTYNERETILILLDRLKQISKTIPRHAFHYLVIDDNSPDGTISLVKEYQKKHKNVSLLMGPKLGLGLALLRGMKHSISELHANIIIQMDADLSHDPSAIPAFIDAIENGSDFAVGSRYIRGGSIPENWAPHRKLFSIVGNAIVRFGLGFPRVHDWTGGYRAYIPKYVHALEKEISAYSGYVFQIAFLHKSILLGASVREIPIHFTDRKFGHSKIAPSEYIRNVFWYVGRERFLSLTKGSFVKFLVVGTIGFFINTIILELFVRARFHPAVGSAIGAETSIISNFFLNNTWTFHSRSIERSQQIVKLLQFNGTSLGALLIQAGSVFTGTHLFGVETYRLYYVIGVGIGLTYNYLMYSKVIWKK